MTPLHPLQTSSSGNSFLLDPAFVASYANLKPPFGFNGLGELTYYRTYSRKKPDGTSEQWYQTIERVVNGVYSMQKRWIQAHRLGWSESKAQRSAQEMYDRMFNMKFLPPGRGLWAMGTSLTEERGLFAALFNCGFVSTVMVDDPAEPFAWTMDASMLGIGVGFDTRGAGEWTIQAPEGRERVVISDDREGWVESLRSLLLAFFLGAALPDFDYSLIRPAGQPIQGFGGVSARPGPLREMHTTIYNLLSDQVGQPISAATIVDLMNVIGKCVVSGNIRRSAELALGEDTEEFINLKNYELNPHRASYGWTSNNSVKGESIRDYEVLAERVRDNGEPGIIWLDNVQQFGRMGEPKPDAAIGANPCSEISLESFELCNLSETFPANHDSLEDFKRTLKFAYLYSKTVTLSYTQWSSSNKVMLRNRRIGVSQSGVQQAIAKLGLATYQKWCEEGYRTLQYYDDIYSDWLAIPRSVRLSTVKPSGSVSLLAGATPGLHWPESRYYIRRVRIATNNPLADAARQAGYPIEPAVGDPLTSIIEVPVAFEDERIRTLDQVPMWEQLAMGAFMQKHWADNMVSQTITFDPDTEGAQLAPALQHAVFHLKSASFLPRLPQGAYAQMPYEAITREEYELRLANLQPLDFGGNQEDVAAERFCSNDTCTI